MTKYMRLPSSYIFALFILLLLAACQTDSSSTETEVPSMAPPEKTHANYYVRYISDEGKLKAQASFLTGADKQHRKPTTFNGVMMNNSEMRLEESNKAKPNYILERDNESLEKVSFSFINAKGQREKDMVAIPLLKKFGFNGKVSKSKDNLLSWEGIPLGDKESLVLLFTNQQNRTLSTIVNGPTKGTSIDIPMEKLRKLELGESSLYIVRKNRTVGESTGNDGSPREVRALTEYYSQSITVDVVE